MIYATALRDLLFISEWSSDFSDIQLCSYLNVNKNVPNIVQRDQNRLYNKITLTTPCVEQEFTIMHGASGIMNHRL